MSPLQGLAWWLGGFGFFYSIYVIAKAVDHPGNKISVRMQCPFRASAAQPS